MYQITYSKDIDKLLVMFPWNGDADYAFENSLENKAAYRGVPTVGQSVVLPVHPTKWNAELIKKHCWPMAMTPAAKDRIEQAEALISDTTSNAFDAQPEITDWTFYRTPFRHQMVAWKYAVDNPYTGLFLDMGLGKTFVAYNVLGYLRNVKGATKPSMVVIPLSSFESWEREARLCGFEGTVVSVHGSRAKKLTLMRGPGDVFLITYESLNNLVDVAKEKQWLYIILDESTKIKNANAERSKTLYELRDHAERRMLLSGSPVTQSYVDLFGQYKFLDPSVFGTSFHKFRSEFCNLGGFSGREIVGYRNLKGLVDGMAKRAIRFTKEECLDLPEKMYQVYKFDLSPAERKAYDELKRQLVLKLTTGGGRGEKVVAQNSLVAGLRLVQICTGYVGGVEYDAPSDLRDSGATGTSVDGVEHTGVVDKPDLVRVLGSSKLALLSEILDGIPADKQIIIWCRFRRNLQQVAGLLAEHGISAVQFSGGLTATERKHAIESFQDGKQRVFLGIIQAGGHGINLTAASYVIYYSQDYSIERRLQSEDRAHRIGQKSAVTYIDLVARHSIEESILTCLRTKKKEAEVVYEFQRNPAKFLEGDIES